MKKKMKETTVNLFKRYHPTITDGMESISNELLDINKDTCTTCMTGLRQRTYYTKKTYIEKVRVS